MELFTHNGTTYQGSLKKALETFKVVKDKVNKRYAESSVLHSPDMYTFEDFLIDFKEDFPKVN